MRLQRDLRPERRATALTRHLRDGEPLYILVWLTAAQYQKAARLHAGGGTDGAVFYVRLLGTNTKTYGTKESALMHALLESDQLLDLT